MENTYRNSQPSANSANSNARASSYHSNNGNKKKNQRKNNSNTNAQRSNNENYFTKNNPNQRNQQQQVQQKQNVETQDFINNYVTNVPLPTSSQNFGAGDACNSYPSQQQYLTNRNRSPNKNNSNQRYKYNNNNKKTYGRSSSNHTVQKNNSSFEFSPRKSDPRVVTSPSDPAINTQLTSSGEFNETVNNLKTSPTKLASAMEEIKVDQLMVADTNEFVSEVVNEIVPITSIIDQDTEINSTVVNRLNVSIENAEIIQEKDNYASAADADQSELSENQYFSANETKHSSSSSSSSVISNASSSSSREHSTSSSSRSSLDKNDSVNKNHDTSVINNTLICDTANNSEIKIVSNEESYTKIVVTDNFTELNLNQAEDEIIKEEDVNLQNNDDSFNDSQTSTDDSSKTMTSNISDIDIDTNGTSKSSEFSDLENLKIRTCDIESDDLCDSSNNNNEESKHELSKELVDVVLEEDEIIQSEVIKQETIITDEELGLVVDKIVSDVITNAVSIAFTQVEAKVEYAQEAAEFEIITTNEKVIDSLKVHYIYEDEDFSLCQNSDADDQKLPVHPLEEHEFMSVESQDLFPVPIDEEEIVTLKKNLENEIQIEYNNQSLQDEFIKLNESVKINELNEALQEAEDITNVESNETLKSTNNNECKKIKVTRRVSSSDVDCFGCTIL